MNLIGHTFEILGIGEDIRRATRALQAAYMQCCVSTTLPSTGRPAVSALEPSICREPSGETYAFNLLYGCTDSGGLIVPSRR